MEEEIRNTTRNVKYNKLMNYMFYKLLEIYWVVFKIQILKYQIFWQLCEGS